MPLANKPYKGLFITLEGGDGAGKSTLSGSICEELQQRGYTVIKTREPGGSELSEYIRDLLLKTPAKVKIGERAELLLFLAARAQHVEEKILPALRSGHIVICERFNDSSIAYQGCARHLGMAYVEELCDLASDHFLPDCTLFLDLEPDVGLKRLTATQDRLEQEKLQFHREVRQGFLHLADHQPKRIAVIDASVPLEQVAKASIQALEPHLKLKPVKRSP